MRRLLVSLAVPLLLAAAPPAPVEYELAPVLQDGAITALAVTVRFTGDPSGTTRFDWPSSWAGQEHLAQWSRDLIIEGAQASEPSPHGGRIIHAAPNAPLTVRYRIVSAFAGDPTVNDSEQAKPVIRPTWFYSVGEALFAAPDGRDDAPATFRWTGPGEIKFASDLEHDAATADAKGKTVNDISESIVIGGRDLRVERSDAAGAPLRVATIGKFGFDLAAFDQLAHDTVAAERAFWHVSDRQPFLITMTPLAADPNRRSYSGAGRTDAFALWMDDAADASGLSWLLAHEYFHTWNARQLGSMEAAGPEAESYWLSEGFTDFYARRLMLRTGLMTPEAFAASWNDTLAAYARSAYRTTGNAAAAKLFWTNHDVEKLPYQRGAMLAAIWDQRLRQNGHENLDDVLRDQRERVAKLATAPALTTTFVTVAAAHKLDVKADVARFIEHGEPIVLPRDVFGRCATVDTVTRPVFERGYDANATTAAGNVVTGLDPASPAYAAGLRNGMKILRRTTGTAGDSTIDYTLVVSDGAAERTIVFRPAGKRTETMQQIVLDGAQFAAQPKVCATALAG